MQPPVSVILPVHNRATYLREAIGSVLDQTYRNVELIIVDDGSTDETVEVLRQYRDVATIRSQPHSGQSAARNLGLRLARGEYISYIDSDDLYDPAKTERMAQVLTGRPEVGLVSCHVYEFRTPHDMRVNRADLATGVGVWFAACMHRAGCVVRVGDFDEALPVLEGFDLYLRIRDEFATHHVAEPLYYHRHHGNNTTLARAHMVDEATRRIQAKRARRAVQLALEVDPASRARLSRPFCPSTPGREGRPEDSELWSRRPKSNR